MGQAVFINGLNLNLGHSCDRIVTFLLVLTFILTGNNFDYKVQPAKCMMHDACYSLYRENNYLNIYIDVHTIHLNSQSLRCNESHNIMSNFI